ncbi:MAG: TVP38/TMEM64 family protein, partial [Planctomycetota bacterium]
MDPSNPFDVPQSTTAQKSGWIRKVLILSGLVVIFGLTFYLFRTYLTFDMLVQQEIELKGYYQSNPLTTYVVTFLIYVVVAGLSIPGGAVFLSLTYAWFFGFWEAILLVSFSSTLGATLAFLVSRYLIRDWIE